MKYRFVVQRENYEDYAAGRVLYARSGSTAFPVRLASEVFQRCAWRLAENGTAPPYTVYDPCCGEAYLLTVLGLFHGDRISRLLASDIDRVALEFARRNLSLLTADGMERRLAEVQQMSERFGKLSHAAALESGHRLKAALAPERAAIRSNCFSFDLEGVEALPEEVREVDLVFTDLPYSRTAAWQGAGDPALAAEVLLSRVRPALSATAVVAVVGSKEQRVSHPEYRRVELLSLGRRRVSILEPTQKPRPAGRATTPVSPAANQ